MDEIISKVLQIYQEHTEGVLVTLCATTGSTPRKSGAKMLVYADGSIAGTVGGGAIEFEAMQKAREIMLTKQPLLWDSDLKDLGMVCGGQATLFLEYLGDGNMRSGNEAKR